MPLPDIPEIQEALSAITLSPKKATSGDCAIPIAFRPAVDEKGHNGCSDKCWRRRQQTERDIEVNGWLKINPKYTQADRRQNMLTAFSPRRSGEVSTSRRPRFNQRPA
jgi:hypothetical protein